MELISVSEAEDKIRTCLSSYELPTQWYSLDEVTGLILARKVMTDRAYPPYDRSMMDGICLAYKSIEASFGDGLLRLAGTIHAGMPAAHALAAGEVWRINTGGAVPSDCDTVIPLEELEWVGEHGVRSNLDIRLV